MFTTYSWTLEPEPGLGDELFADSVKHSSVWPQPVDNQYRLNFVCVMQNRIARSFSLLQLLPSELFVIFLIPFFNFKTFIQ